MSNSYFFYSNNAPNAKIILNRNTNYEFDITSDVISFNTSNDIGSLFGNFTVIIDNTNDKHMDRFGNADIATMSSIEIFVLSNVAEANRAPSSKDNITVHVQEGQSISSIIENTYGITSYSAGDTLSAQEATNNKNYYLAQTACLNQNVIINFIGGSSSVIDSNNPTASADFELEGGQILFLPPPITSYKRIFLGVVENVTETFSAATPMTITLNGESFGYWLKASTINLQPGLSSASAGVSNINANDLTSFSNRYSQTVALDIFKDLIKFSTNQTLTVADFSLATTNTSYENLTNTNQLSQTFQDDLGEAFTKKADGSTALTIKDALANAVINGKKGIDAGSTLQDLSNALDDLEESIHQGTYIDGTPVNSIPTTPGSKNPVESNMTEYQKLSDSYNKAFTNLTAQQNCLIQMQEPSINASKADLNAQSAEITKAQQQVDNAKTSISNNGVVTSQINSIEKLKKTIQQQINSTQQTGNSVLDEIGIMDMWRQIFSSIILEAADTAYLQQVYPFQTIMQGPDQLDGDFQPKSSIGKMVADALNFEFYCDTNGHFVVKPPLYNIGIPDDDPTYILEQQDIISWNINNSTDGIITRIGVTGQMSTLVSSVREITYNVHTDLNLIKKYGIQSTELQNIIFLRTQQDCKNYGESYMAKNNQELKNANVTIMGRPDIRLGVACYLKPRDTVYYIKAISHDFQVGSQYTTTLTLVGARKLIMGFLVNSSITTQTKAVLNGNITIRSTTQPDGIPGSGIQASGAQTTIQHYQLANSLSPTMYPNYPDVKTSPVTQEFSLIKNAYIITSHPNVGYIGLIIPPAGTIYNDINFNTFNYIYTSATISSQQGKTSTLKSSLQDIQSEFGKNIQPFTNITNFLLDYIINNDLGNVVTTNIGNYPPPTVNGVTDVFGISQEQRDYIKNLLDYGNEDLNCDGFNPKNDYNKVAQSFNQAVLNDFINQFLNYISSSKQTSQKDNRTGDYETWTATANYFNSMVSDISYIGSYRQYTDEDGREYPILIDYGRTFLTEGAYLSANTNTAAQQSTNPSDKADSLVSKIISAAKQYSGNNVSQPVISNPPSIPGA